MIKGGKVKGEGKNLRVVKFLGFCFYGEIVALLNSGFINSNRTLRPVLYIIQTIDNEMIHLITYCLNCIGRD